MNFKTTCLVISLVVSGFVMNAQIQEPFSVRYSENLNGDFTIIANNVISRTPTGNYNGNANNQDFTNNVYVDIDNDPNTFNSSNANFSDPSTGGACVTIFRAFLYWAAADAEQPNGSDNQPNWNFNDVKLMLPGETTYTTVTADDVIFRGRTSHFSNDPYICVKDITPQVLALPNKFGSYQVANVEAAEGLMAHDQDVGTAGGWQIVFVYESPNVPAKNITLFDGYAHVTNIINNFDINFSGFQTTPGGNVNANIVLGALEGDRNLSGDRLQIRNVANNFVDITAPQRNANNFFNSRITDNNGDFVDRNPASINTLGFDAAVFPLDNPGNSVIGNNQTSATLRLTSNQEIYGLYLLGLAVEIYRPSLNPLVVTQTSGTNPTNPGDTLGFNFNIQNNGNDNALNVTLATVIPPQATLIPITNLPAGVTYTYDPVSGDLVFNVADGMLNVGDPPIDIDFELEINDECYFLEDDCTLSFDLQFTATYVGEQNPGQVISVSTADPNSCSAVPYSVNINQPIVNWATAPGALDVTVSCDDTAALNQAQSLEPVPDKCNFILNKTSGPFVAGSCPSVGTYTNTWNFTDACGVTIADYVQTITVTDNEDPTASNPPAINVVCAGDIPAPNPSVVTDAADNCSTPVVAFVSDVSDNQPCPETITRTYSVTDACGNAITVTQLIIVSDDILPTASNPPSINVQCIGDIPAPDPAVVTDAADNCSNPVVAFVSEVSDNQSCPETITRTYSVTDDCGNSINVTQQIIVSDDILPTASNPATISVQCAGDIPAPDPAVVTDATDNCSTPVVNFVSDVSDNQGCPETITRTYSVTDDCGNSITVSQLIIVLDDILPTASNPAEINVLCAGDIPAPDPAVVTDEADNCATPVVTFVSDESDNQGCPETITRTYSITDDCGNSITVTQLIMVLDDVLPTASNPPSIGVECIEDVPAPDPTVVSDASDNCSTPVVAFVSDVSDNQSCPETITRTYSVTDDCGNTINVTQDIVIRDVTAPILVTNLQPEINITCEEIPEIPDLDFTDNCTASVLVEYDEEMEIVTEIDYDIIRTWVVADDCDNRNTYQQRIRVRPTFEVDVVSLEICPEDDPVNLETLISNTSDLNGNWSGEDIDILDGTVFDPADHEMGEYQFEYTFIENECEWATTFNVSIGASCIELPCIQSRDDITISKLVSANNDGFNDFFEVNYILNPNANESCDITVQVEIFNRWGVRVYKDNNYNNDWYGVSPSGSFGDATLLPTGTYYYVVTLRNSGYDPIQGFILLGTE
ncbi:MAG: gliding motility-associated C-terminal domain-containing protein [Bacteroidia bacterium]|nr:gliding motility-associated C-terminal domain-containing protein [Bacteroidia bacterium]